MFSVPSGYPINPNSGQNWEGTGVQPDVVVAAPAAFDTSYVHALQHVIGLGGHGYRRSILDEAEQEMTSRSQRT